MSLVQTIKNAFVPVHPEGYKFIAIFFVVSFVLGAGLEPAFLCWPFIDRLVRIFLSGSRACHTH